MRCRIWVWVTLMALVVTGGETTFADSGRWQTQLQAPWPWDFRKVSFSDNGRGWLLGEWGTLFRSRDWGASWAQVLWRDSLGCEPVAGSPECAGPDAEGLAVVADSLIWIVGGRYFPPDVDWNGFVLHSPDGGDTWTWQLSLPLTALHDVVFANARRGWAVGDSGTIVSTADGGRTWQAQTSGVTTRLSAVFFADSLWGWAVGGQGVVLHTADGGLSWQPRRMPLAGYTDVFFVDRLHGWVLESYHSILSSADGGTTWQEQRITDLDFPLQSLFFLDGQKGWVTLGRRLAPIEWQEYRPSLLATCDGGQTWAERMVPFHAPVNEVVFLDAQIGFLAGAEGTVFQTTNGGENWQSLVSVPRRELRKVYFADQNRGWATGDRLSLRTSNGGMRWELVPYMPWQAMLFADSLRGWALGDSVYRTEDGGQSWSTLAPPLPGRPQAAFILNEHVGWLSYSFPGDRLMARTRDGGQSWQMSTSVPLNVTGLFFADSAHGWAVGTAQNLPVIFFTSDGGASWHEQYRGSSPYCWYEDVFFVDAMVGWAAGMDGSVVTMDGGATWRERGPAGCTVHFVTPEEGWIGDRASDRIYHTVDGGGTWEIASPHSCSDLYFLDRDHGWAVGGRASIYHWSSELKVQRSPSGPLPTEFRLSAYPNPSFGIATLVLGGQSKGLAAVDIINSSGRLVRRLVMSTGTQERSLLHWDGKADDGASCPSGVYLIRAHNGRHRAQCKIVLLR